MGCNGNRVSRSSMSSIKKRINCEPIRIALTLSLCIVSNSVIVAGEDSSAVTILEHRGPPLPAVGSRQVTDGVEIGGVLPMPSVIRLKNGRLAMFGDGKACFS